LYLGIDCGTQGTKVLLVEKDGAVRGRGYAPHALIELESGRREQDPQWWVEAMFAAVSQALGQCPGTTIEGIAVSGQQHGLVVLGANKKVIRPAKLWNDTETAPQNAQLIERLGGREAFSERFGIVPLTGYTVSKLLWLQQREPENFAKVRHILLPHEYLNFVLTGEMCAEYGDASGTAYFDVRSRTWEREVLDAIDGGSGQLFAALPRLIEHDAIVGTVLPKVAQALGLGSTCIVAPGGGDNMMGAIGTGNVAEGIVTLSLGTSSTVYSYSNTPVLDATGNVAPFCSSTGSWLPLVCTMNATNVVTQTLHTLSKTVQDIESLLAATSPGADGLTFLPFLNGERTPDLPTARGTMLGISSLNLSASNLVRAAIEGTSFGVLHGLDLVLNGKPCSSIRIIGGGSKSTAWRQLIADASGVTVTAPAEEEAGALGAAMQAMFVHGRTLGKEETYNDLAARCVHLDEKLTAQPDGTLRKGYDEAATRYRKALHEVYCI
jgi:xylulokinase